MSTSTKPGQVHPTIVGLAAVTRSIRARERLSRAALAQRAGLSVSFIAAVEHGTGNPTVTRILRLADALGLEGGAPELLAQADEMAERLTNATIRPIRSRSG